MSARSIFEFSVSTRSRTDFVDITHQVAQLLSKSGVREGIATVYVPHTTAAITINENADPSVMSDMGLALDKMVRWDDPDYGHSEGNSAAHVKSSLVGCSINVIVRFGTMALGTWQGIFFCEFDGPRNRKVFVKISGE
ncbi:MAG: YjbQ family protein [Nitrospinae bacterium]|nr:YjbQ family protein [Nitrospinota bacterium]